MDKSTVWTVNAFLGPEAALMIFIAMIALDYEFNQRHSSHSHVCTLYYEYLFILFYTSQLVFLQADRHVEFHVQVCVCDNAIDLCNIFLITIFSCL